MSQQNRNHESKPPDNRGFVEHWKKAGPMLAKVRRAELRNYDYEKHRHEIDALLAIAAAHAAPRTTSGLVEQQRLFLKASRKAT